MISQALLLAGYARHALQPGPSLVGVERWVWLIYPLGVVLLPLAHFLIGWWALASFGTLPLLKWFLGPIGVALAALIMFIGFRFWDRTSGIIAFLQDFLSLNWLYRLLWASYRYLVRVFGFLTSVLEGEGGVLWAFLILVLLFSLLARNNGGG